MAGSWPAFSSVLGIDKHLITSLGSRRLLTDSSTYRTYEPHHARECRSQQSFTEPEFCCNPHQKRQPPLPHPRQSHIAPDIRQYTYAAQRPFAVKAMAAQYNNLSGSIQSEGGAIFAGTNAGRDVHFNNIFSGISDEDRRIQYILLLRVNFGVRTQLPAIRPRPIRV